LATELTIVSKRLLTATSAVSCGIKAFSDTILIRSFFPRLAIAAVDAILLLNLKLALGTELVRGALVMADMSDTRIAERDIAIAPHSRIGRVGVEYLIAVEKMCVPALRPLFHVSEGCSSTRI
jgi:hypothetical protein